MEFYVLSGPASELLFHLLCVGCSSRFTDDVVTEMLHFNYKASLIGIKTRGFFYFHCFLPIVEIFRVH